MKRIAGCWIVPAAFCIDRLTKLWARGSLFESPPIAVIPGVFRFIYVQNTGAAFGLLSERPGILLAATGAALFLLLLFLLLRGQRLARLPAFSLWLLLSGALGNFADRLLYGFVIDFMEFTFVSFPVFNVADCLVVAAFALLSGYVLFAGAENLEAGGT